MFHTLSGTKHLKAKFLKDGEKSNKNGGLIRVKNFKNHCRLFKYSLTSPEVKITQNKLTHGRS